MGIFEDKAKDRVDWTDQDLLTYEEAEERLVEQEAKLVAALADEADEAQREQITSRLQAARELLARYRDRA